jgi:hypothetical protein
LQHLYRPPSLIPLRGRRVELPKVLAASHDFRLLLPPINDSSRHCPQRGNPRCDRVPVDYRDSPTVRRPGPKPSPIMTFPVQRRQRGSVEGQSRPADSGSNPGCALEAKPLLRRSLCRRTTSLIAMLAVLAACGSRPDIDESPHNSGVTGVTVVDAGCLPTPVQQACPDQPMAAHLVVTRGDSGVAVTFVTSDRIRSARARVHGCDSAFRLRSAMRDAFAISVCVVAGSDKGLAVCGVHAADAPIRLVRDG